MGYCQQDKENERPKKLSSATDLQQKVTTEDLNNSVINTEVKESVSSEIIDNRKFDLKTSSVSEESNLSTCLSSQDVSLTTQENNNLHSFLDENKNGPVKIGTESIDEIDLVEKSLKDLKVDEVSENEVPVEQSNRELPSLQDFEFLKRLGEGSFGDVYLVRKNEGVDSGALYALKMICKDMIKHDDYYEVHFECERKALELVRDGAFLSTLHYAFQSDTQLSLVMDYNSGGQLLEQFIGKNILFESHMRVYLAELLVAVDFLHVRGIIHRDIKPENVLLDRQGHAVLIDYGLSKVEEESQQNNSHVGTEPYIAPEILLRKPHDRMVDFWSLGVLGFEMVAGEPPFSLEQSDDKLRKAVLEREPQFSAKKFKKPCKSILSGLMQKNPKSRLGAVTKSGGGMAAVMGHKFFKMLKWEDVGKRKLRPPNVPPTEDHSKSKKLPFRKPTDPTYRKHFKNYEFSWLEQQGNSQS